MFVFRVVFSTPSFTVLSVLSYCAFICKLFMIGRLDGWISKLQLTDLLLKLCRRFTNLKNTFLNILKIKIEYFTRRLSVSEQSAIEMIASSISSFSTVIFPSPSLAILHLPQHTEFSHIITSDLTTPGVENSSGYVESIDWKNARVGRNKPIDFYHLC